MTYTPKPGDRVTSPLLVGEWEVELQRGDQSLARVTQEGSAVYVSPDTLTPVAPPLPPEPPAGSAVYVDGVCYIQTSATRWFPTDPQRNLARDIAVSLEQECAHKDDQLIRAHTLNAQLVARLVAHGIDVTREEASDVIDALAKEGGT